MCKRRCKRRANHVHASLITLTYQHTPFSARFFLKVLFVENEVFDVLHALFVYLVFGDLLLDLVPGVNDGGVIPAAEELSDGSERHFGKNGGHKIHCHLTGFHEFFGLLFAAKVALLDIEVTARDFRDLRDRNIVALTIGTVAQSFRHKIDAVCGTSVEGCKITDGFEHTFKQTNVVLFPFRKIIDDFRRNVDLEYRQRRRLQNDWSGDLRCKKGL